jgi:hypothetical protein
MATPSLDIGDAGNIGGVAFSTQAMPMGQGCVESLRCAVDLVAPWRLLSRPLPRPNPSHGEVGLAVQEVHVVGEE